MRLLLPLRQPPDVDHRKADQTSSQYRRSAGLWYWGSDGVISHNLAVIVNACGECRAGSRNVNRGEAAPSIDEAMGNPGRVDKISHDLAAVIDPERNRVKPAGGNDCGKGSANIKETVPSKDSHDLAVVVNPPGNRSICSTGGVNCRKMPPVSTKPWYPVSKKYPTICP